MTPIARKIAILMSISLLLTASVALAQDNDKDKNATVQVSNDFGGFVGQMSTAEVVPQGSIDLGAYAGFFEDMNGFFGTFRMGLLDNLDWEVKSGLLDLEYGDDPHFMIGTAFKYHFIHGEDKVFPDMAISGNFEYYDLDVASFNGSSLGFGIGLIGSYPIWLAEKHRLTPYGRLSTRIEHNDVGDWDDTDFDIGLNLGTQYAPSQRIHFYGEFQFDDQLGFMTGVNFAVY